jgi:hypothetical protein
MTISHCLLSSLSPVAHPHHPTFQVDAQLVPLTIRPPKRSTTVFTRTVAPHVKHRTLQMVLIGAHQDIFSLHMFIGTPQAPLRPSTQPQVIVTTMADPDRERTALRVSKAVPIARLLLPPPTPLFGREPARRKHPLTMLHTGEQGAGIQRALPPQRYLPFNVYRTIGTSLHPHPVQPLHERLPYQPPPLHLLLQWRDRCDRLLCRKAPSLLQRSACPETIASSIQSQALP